jgi:hypothetical protein
MDIRNACGVVYLALLLLPLGAEAGEVIHIATQTYQDTPIHVDIDSFIDCGQQASSPQQVGNRFIVQIIFDPSIVNCNIATRHFSFVLAPLTPGNYRVETVRISNGVTGLVTGQDFQVIAFIPTLSAAALVTLSLSLLFLARRRLWPYS